MTIFMKNEVKINESFGNQSRREEVRGLLKRLPADITMQDGSFPRVDVEFEVIDGDAYALRVPTGYKVRTYDQNCHLINMNIVDVSPEQKWVHVKDYIDFGDAQHPRKISHRFYLNPEVNEVPPKLS